MRRPAGLSDIVRVSRQHNPEVDITGIISYREGQYLQVLEGPNDEVDRLIAKILADSRHEDAWVFIDETVTKRDFDNWSISLFDYVEQGSFFDEFVENNSAVLKSFNEQQIKRIQPFINVEKTAIIDEKDYKGKNLKLLAWPDLNNESNPQMIMALCVKLTKSPYPFNALISSGEFGTLPQVTQTIKGFEQLGILSITESEPLDEQIVNEKKPNKFYGAIKKFLGMR